MHSFSSLSSEKEFQTRKREKEREKGLFLILLEIKYRSFASFISRNELNSLFDSPVKEKIIFGTRKEFVLDLGADLESS